MSNNNAEDTGINKALQDTETQYSNGQDSSAWQFNTDKSDKCEQIDKPELSHIHSNDEAKVLYSKQLSETHESDPSPSPSDENTKYVKEGGPAKHLPGVDNTAVNVRLADKENEKAFNVSNTKVSLRTNENFDGESADMMTTQEVRDHERKTGDSNTDYEAQITTDNSSVDITITKDKKKAALEKARKAQTNADKNDDRKTLKQSLESGYKKAKKKYTYFWKSHHVFSQWHWSKFTIEKEKFTCAEQYMMFQKATLFGNDEIAKKVLKTENPRKMKALGRQVSQFKFNVWVDHCLEVVKTGSIAKYSQNDAMKMDLYSTYPTILVEASPLDNVWGIGLDENDQRAWDEAMWKGMNLLGYMLTEVRDELMFKDGIIPDDYRKIYMDELKDKLKKRRDLETLPGTSLDEEYDMLQEWQ